MRAFGVMSLSLQKYFKVIRLSYWNFTSLAVDSSDPALALSAVVL
jgi:hypothetical protein